MAHSPRGWTGARTPSALKRVRQAQRQRAVNQPRRTAAKTLISKAVAVATDGGTADAAREAVERAVSALDRAAKMGVIHKNAADRRKSRLMLKVNAVLGGEAVASAAKASRQIGKAAATKQAKARIAASRATKAKGAQTAAGKARAALARTTRDTSTERAAPSATDEPTTPRRSPSRPAAKAETKSSSRSKAASPKASSPKPAAEKASGSKSSSTKASSAKSSGTKSSAVQTTASKSTTKKS